MLSEKPSRYITPSVPSSETMVATAGITVARAVRRKAETTSTTRMMAMVRVISISCREARMETVESDATSILMSPGRSACSSGSTARTLLTVRMMLAPGCWVTRTTMAGRPLNRPRVRTSCTLSVTVATSCSRTPAPLRQPTIRPR